MYDLTNLITTIASSSATLAAIIGGFIASRLIALNAERAELTVRIHEIDEEMVFRKSEVAEARKELIEDDAVDFILYHIEELIDGKPIDVVYSAAERPGISKEELLPFWNRALELIPSLREFIRVTKIFEIPSGFAERLSDYEYEICKEAISVWESRSNRQATRFPYNIGMDLNRMRFRVSRDANYWHQKKKEDINVHMAHLEWLRVRKKQLESRQEALRKPRGVVDGLIVFLVAVVVGIIIPLMNIPMVLEDYAAMVVTKRLYIGLFSVVLIVVFSYFIGLARWKDVK